MHGADRCGTWLDASSFGLLLGRIMEKARKARWLVDKVEKLLRERATLRVKGRRKGTGKNVVKGFRLGEKAGHKLHGKAATGVVLQRKCRLVK